MCVTVVCVRGVVWCGVCSGASAQRRKQEHAKDEADRRQLLAQQQLERMRINKQRRREHAEMFARGGDSGVNLPFFAGGQCFATNTLHTLLCQVRRRSDVLWRQNRRAFV